MLPTKTQVLIYMDSTLVSQKAKSSGDCVLAADGRFDYIVELYGEVGSPISGSIYFRDYCFICEIEPIRVPLCMIGFPNACSFCQPAYRGTQGVTEAERMFWIKQTWDEAEVISA